MNYHLNQDGKEAGIFPLEELHRRRKAGELNGNEYVWCSGMTNWMALDAVLRQNGLEGIPVSPMAPARASSSGNLMIWLIGGGLFIFLAMVVTGVVFVVHFANKFAAASPAAFITSAAFPASPPGALEAASKLVEWTTNTLTEAEVRKKSLAFRQRQWIEGYKERSRHDLPCDAEAAGFLQAWIDRNYTTNAHPDQPGTYEWADKLAAEPGCDDPLVLTACGVNCLEVHEATRRLEKAVAGFPQSKHRAYPKFYATVMLAQQLNGEPARVSALDASALQHFKDMFADGGIQPAEEPEVAEIFLNGWGAGFFNRNRDAVCAAAKDAGKDFEWLARVLEGERQISAAWAARGGDYASGVSQKGWQGFSEHLAQARSSLTAAWESHPEYPQAAERMITVSLGDSGIEQMRLWFDRCVTAQLDYPRAWKDFAWGLRPRWYGDTNSMLAFGVMALNTGRFDTDVPRKLFDRITDLEQEESIPTGRHIYWRADVWPFLQKMYEGYIAAPAAAADRDGWRSAYCVIAFLAAKYDVSRAQMELLHWQLNSNSLPRWGRELSLMPLELAARTGSASNEIKVAERSFRRAQNAPPALLLYTNLLAPAAAHSMDARTLEFVRDRVAQLELKEKLSTGEWVDFLPADAGDPNWVFAREKTHRLADGALEVESGPDGHFIFCRARLGGNFEVRGEFEAVRSSTGAFQAGLILGLPDAQDSLWYAFRMKRNDTEHDVVSFANGWTTAQIYQPAKIEAGTNSFDFRFESGRVTASVNGREIFHEAKPPRTIGVGPADYQLGLGAYNDMNETVIRYGKVQVRKLTSKSRGRV